MLVSKDVKGVRDAKESTARCRFARWCLVVPVGGAGVVVVASMECSQQGMSSASCDESLSGSGRFLSRVYLLWFQ